MIASKSYFYTIIDFRASTYELNVGINTPFNSLHIHTLTNHIKLRFIYFKLLYKLDFVQNRQLVKMTVYIKY